jgi:glycosyltransferase involved in cell wall biosynthesis
MRVAFFGNVANNFYQIIRALRARSCIDAHLYLDARDQMGMRPESDYPDLKNYYPEWIHEGEYITPTSMLFPWKSPLVNELERYDAIIVSYLGPMFAPFIHKPFFFFVTGSDLTHLPFPREFRFRDPNLKSKVVGSIKGFWLRRGIRHVAQIWTQPYSPYLNALHELGIDPDRISPVYFPLAIDINKFKFDGKARTRRNENIHRILSGSDFIVFHPSRLMIQNHPQLKAAGQWKQNDLLFRGFAKFIERSGRHRSVLVMPDRTQSNDIALGKRLIHEMGLEPYVVWLQPPRPEGFTRDELIPFYSIADVVADDFGIGWFGSVVIEALSIGRPVITYIDEKVMGRIYPWHPILSARTEEEIAGHLMSLYRDEKFKREIGGRGRIWIEEFHSEEGTSPVYVRQITQLCDRLTSERH